MGFRFLTRVEVVVLLHNAQSDSGGPVSLLRSRYRWHLSGGEEAAE